MFVKLQQFREWIDYIYTNKIINKQKLSINEVSSGYTKVYELCTSQKNTDLHKLLLDLYLEYCQKIYTIFNNNDAQLPIKEVISIFKYLDRYYLLKNTKELKNLKIYADEICAISTIQ